MATNYGADHQRKREKALRLLRDGDPCAICGRGMYRTDRLHLDHAQPCAMGGADGPTRLVHASCNLSRGGKLGGKLKGWKTRQQRGPTKGATKTGYCAHGWPRYSDGWTRCTRPHDPQARKPKVPRY